LKGRQSALDEMSLQLEKYKPFIYLLKNLSTSEQNNGYRYILWGPHKENTDLKVPADICVILKVSNQLILRNFFLLMFLWLVTQKLTSRKKLGSYVNSIVYHGNAQFP
jgi:hypothetical protein